AGGGPLLVAGLCLLGSALVRYGVVDRLDGSALVPLLLGVLFAGVAAALWLRPGGVLASGLADLMVAGVVVCVILLLLRTPLRAALRVLFAPLGRMALTNYLPATVLVLAAARPLGVPIGESLTVAYWTAGAI